MICLLTYWAYSRNSALNCCYFIRLTNSLIIQPPTNSMHYISAIIKQVLTIIRNSAQKLTVIYPSSAVGTYVLYVSAVKPFSFVLALCNQLQDR